MTAEQSKVESLQHSLEEQRRIMTQQLSMERAELERAKVRWGRHLQVPVICPVSLTGAALRCVEKERAGCWAAASFLCLLNPAPARTGNLNQSSPLAHGCKRLLCACMMYAGSRGVGGQSSPCRVHARHHGLEPTSRCRVGFGGRDGLKEKNPMSNGT